MDPKSSPKHRKGGKVSFTKQAGPRAQEIGAEVFSASEIPVAFFPCVKAGLMDPQCMMQRLICLFRLSLKGKMLIFVWASLFFGLALCLFGIVSQLWKCIQRLPRLPRQGWGFLNWSITSICGRLLFIFLAANRNKKEYLCFS